MPNTQGEHLLGKLAPDITARADEIEAERLFPLDLVESLRSAGAFSMFVPQSHVAWSSICRRPCRSSRPSAKSTAR
jgi:hypothetical protein